MVMTAKYQRSSKKRRYRGKRCLSPSKQTKRMVGNASSAAPVLRILGIGRDEERREGDRRAREWREKLACLTLAISEAAEESASRRAATYLIAGPAATGVRLTVPSLSYGRRPPHADKRTGSALHELGDCLPIRSIPISSSR